MPKKDPDGGTWAAIAHYMTEHRTHLGWTQRYAAEQAGISADTWNALERGRKDRVKEITLVRIARSLGRDPQELLEIAEGDRPAKDPQETPQDRGKSPGGGLVQR